MRRMTKHLALAALLLSTSCAVEPAPSTGIADQPAICLTCGDDGNGGGEVTYDEAIGVSTSWVAATYPTSRGISAGCDSFEIGGAVGFSCWVAFDFFGSRYTAQCTVWDNTSAGGAEGHNSCGIVAN
jgi:hypothetical protein